MALSISASLFVLIVGQKGLLCLLEKTYRGPASTRFSLGVRAPVCNDSVTNGTLESHKHPASDLDCNAEDSSLTLVDLASITASLETDSEDAALFVADNAATTGGTQRGNKETMKNKPGVTGGNCNRIQKKQASDGRQQLFEYSHLGPLRDGFGFELHFKIYWKPTWGTPGPGKKPRSL